jgi:glycosyltransferase involved in cell wall biosynthesis
MPDKCLDRGVEIFLIFRSPIGGLFKHVRDLTEGFNRLGYKVGLIFSSENPLDLGDLKILEEQAQLGILRLKMNRNPSLFDIFAIWKIWVHLKRRGGGILHGHGAKGGFYSRLVSILLGCKKFKTIYTLHGGVLHFDKGSPKGFLFFGIEKFLLKFTNGIIFESIYAKNKLKNILGAIDCNSAVIYNGIFSGECKSPPIRKKYDFIFLGELRVLKGVEYLLLAIKILQEEGLDISLALYGVGPDEEAFKLIAKKNSISNIYWMGYTSNPEAALRAGRCLVIPSLAESLPYVAIEAGVNQVPIIATDVGGISEILGEEYPMVPPRNAALLAKSMKEFLANPEEVIISQTHKTRDRIKRMFDIDRMAVETIEFYAKQLNAEI